jgi:hypothetical protein
MFGKSWQLVLRPFQLFTGGLARRRGSRRLERIPAAADVLEDRVVLSASWATAAAASRHGFDHGLDLSAVAPTGLSSSNSGGGFSHGQHGHGSGTHMSPSTHLVFQVEPTDGTAG